MTVPKLICNGLECVNSLIVLGEKTSKKGELRVKKNLIAMEGGDQKKKNKGDWVLAQGTL